MKEDLICSKHECKDIQSSKSGVTVSHLSTNTSQIEKGIANLLVSVERFVQWWNNFYFSTFIVRLLFGEKNMKKPRKENERVSAAALWALSRERLELHMRGDVWKQRWRSNFCVIILKLITCSEGKICYTNFSWHYPGYLEEYLFIRNLLDFRWV